MGLEITVFTGITPVKCPHERTTCKIGMDASRKPCYLYSSEYDASAEDWQDIDCPYECEECMEDESILYLQCGDISRHEKYRPGDMVRYKNCKSRSIGSYFKWEKMTRDCPFLLAMSDSDGCYSGKEFLGALIYFLEKHPGDKTFLSYLELFKDVDLDDCIVVHS